MSSILLFGLPMVMVPSNGRKSLAVSSQDLRLAVHPRTPPPTGQLAMTTFCTSGFTLTHPLSLLPFSTLASSDFLVSDPSQRSLTTSPNLSTLSMNSTLPHRLSSKWSARSRDIGGHADGKSFTAQDLRLSAMSWTASADTASKVRRRGFHGLPHQSGVEWIWNTAGGIAGGIFQRCDLLGRGQPFLIDNPTAQLCKLQVPGLTRINQYIEQARTTPSNSSLMPSSSGTGLELSPLSRIQLGVGTSTCYMVFLVNRNCQIVGLAVAFLRNCSTLDSALHSIIGSIHSITFACAYP